MLLNLPCIFLMNRLLFYKFLFLELEFTLHLCFQTICLFHLSSQLHQRFMSLLLRNLRVWTCKRLFWITQLLSQGGTVIACYHVLLLLIRFFSLFYVTVNLLKLVLEFEYIFVETNLFSDVRDQQLKLSITILEKPLIKLYFIVNVLITLVESLSV